MASSDAFDVTIKGVGGHGAHPHLAVDSIVGAAQFIDQLQTIVSREIAPISSAVVTIGRIAGGTARNIIAPSVELSASVRTLESEIAAKVEAAVRRILEGLKIGMRLDYELKWTKLTPVLRNDKATMGRVLDAAREVLGPANVIEMPSSEHGERGFRVVRRARALGASAHRLEDRRPRHRDPSRRLSVERAGHPARDEGDDASGAEPDGLIQASRARWFYQYRQQDLPMPKQYAPESGRHLFRSGACDFRQCRGAGKSDTG